MTKYEYKKSTRKDKKLMTVVNGKTIHFGNPKYEHYKDKTGIWKNKDHNDKKRRDSYHSRHKAIKLKDGSLAYKNPKYAAYHAMKILW